MTTPVNVLARRQVAARRWLQLLNLDVIADCADELADDESRRLLRQLAARLRALADDAEEAAQLAGTIATSCLISPARSGA